MMHQQELVDESRPFEAASEGKEPGWAADYGSRSLYDTSGLLPNQIDSLKGILIILVVLGHNTLITGQVPGLFAALYSFHVLQFLLIPFWRADPRLSWGFARDRMVRYLVPHYAFYILACVLFTLLISPEPWQERLLKGLLGGLIGSTETTNAGSGLGLFWFLPALFTLTLVRSALRGRARYVWLPLLMAHLLVGALPEDVHRLTPYGLITVAYIYPVGLLVERVWPNIIAPQLRWMGIGAALFWIPALLYIAAVRPTLATGGENFFSILRPDQLLLDDMSLLAGLIVLSALCTTQIGTFRPLLRLGQHSLLIYLIHTFVYQGLLMVSSAFGSSGSLSTGWVLLSLTLLLSYALARFILRQDRIRRWLTPRNASEWPPSRRSQRSH